MDFLAEGFRRALALLFSGDAEVYGIALLTFRIGLISTVLACGLGIPLGFMLATRPFWGRRAALTVVNTALAFPTVVLGLLLYGLLSRRGPLGAMGWLYTWQAIALGDVLLALPIAAALAAAAVQGVDPRIRRTAETLGAGRWRTAWTVAREARFALAAVLTTAFGHVVAEIGAAMTVVGPNGSGKSTLLRLLALLERPSAGRVLLNGVVVTPGGAARRRVTLVEQRPILFQATVRENLEFGLQVRGIRRAGVNRRVENIAARLAITPLLGRRRHELSDGEVQRVAVARALAVEPDVLLLDEPASSADRAAALTLYRALAEERARRPMAVCLASHQLEDAYRWADDVRALADGRLSPVTPENLFRVELQAAESGDLKHACVGTVEIAAMTDKTGPAILAVPPTDIFVSREPLASSARNTFPGRATSLARRRPDEGAVHVTADVGVELVAVITEEAVRDLALAPGSPVVFSFKASAVRVF